MKGGKTRARTRQPFRKPCSKFPGRWVGGEERGMLVSLFEMSCELNWVADKNKEQ